MTIEMDLSDVRRDYESHGITRKDMDPDPFVQFGQWLQRARDLELLDATAMTEPDLASSDAKNISCRAVRDGDEWVINGEKTYISGAGDHRCKIMICMVKSNPENGRHQQHSQILVPMDTPGVEVVRPMHVFANDDAPHGHMHIRLDNVRVPEANVILGAGRGFEIQAPMGWLRIPTPFGVAVDGAGNVYVAGRAGGISVAKSTTLRDPALPPAFDSAIAVDLGGFLTAAPAQSGHAQEGESQGDCRHSSSHLSRSS